MTRRGCLQSCNLGIINSRSVSVIFKNDPKQASCFGGVFSPLLKERLVYIRVRLSRGLSLAQRDPSHTMLRFSVNVTTIGLSDVVFRCVVCK